MHSLMPFFYSQTLHGLLGSSSSLCAGLSPYSDSSGVTSLSRNASSIIPFNRSAPKRMTDPLKEKGR